jgi:hypothetical protein
MSPHKGGLKSREQARRRKQGFSLHKTSDRSNSKGGQDSEGSMISSLPDSSSTTDQNIYTSASNHGIAENYNGSAIVLESLDNPTQQQYQQQQQYQHQYQTQQAPPLPPSAPQQQQQQNQSSGGGWFGIF